MGRIVASDYGKLLAVSGLKLNSAVQAGIAMNKGDLTGQLSNLPTVFSELFARLS